MPAILPQMPFRLHTANDEEGLIVGQLTARPSMSHPYVIDPLAFVPTPLGLDDLPAIGPPATLSLAPSDMASADLRGAGSNAVP